MDNLKSSLDTYRIQLSQIEAAIGSGQHDNDLITLQQELKELIALTEESLLAYEKSNILSSLDNNDNLPSAAILSTEETTRSNPNSSETMDDIMASFYADIGSTASDTAQPKSPQSSCRLSNNDTASTVFDHDDSSDDESTSSFASNESAVLNDEFLKTIEDSDDITGVKCQAPYRTDWSGRQFHNAMIMSVNATAEDDTDSHEAIFVQVLFLNPTLEQMKPCPYFLDGKCRFGESDCKFSHGFPVSLYQLRKFREPDFSKFVVKSHCLAKHPSGIWHPATLVKTLENHQYEVQFSHQNLSRTLDIDDVLPMSHGVDIDDNLSDSSESVDEDAVIVVNEKQGDNSSSEDKLGKWEEFTTGFGSKMLLKFGYKMGEGLGIDKKGRIEPVPVVVLPPGKSLDHCMKMKEKKLGIVDNSTNASHQRRKRHRHTVFHFLNRTLGDRKQNEDYLRKLLPKDSFGIKKQKPKSGQCKIKIELVKNDTKIKQLKEKIKRYEDSIARNETRDPGVAKKQKIKLKEAATELKRIQSNNKAIELHQSRADTHRKMTRF